jgi:hypothetical protein
MRFATVLINSFAFLAATVYAAPQQDVDIRSQSSHQQCQFDSKNSPQCWGEWSLSTDWYKSAPNTGVIREYWFNVSQHYAAPDGVERLVMTINGSVPGPTIYADWGDTIGKSHHPQSGHYILCRLWN